jgi:hypothetical protein
MKTTIYLGAICFILFLLFSRGSQMFKEVSPISFHVQGFEYPANVKAVIDLKCYGCHNLEGKSADAKKGLLWDSIPSYSKAKQVAKLDDIIGVLDDGSMPPEKFVEKKPEAKLTKEESKILKSWAEKTAGNLMK